MARVLVVDDDVTVREVVVSYLRAAGHDVDEAGDGAAGLDAMRRAPADLVVLDLMMPRLDGRETCRRLRASGDVPVIMLSALAGEEARVDGLELGADDYVTKPFSPRELVLRVEALLRRSRRGDVLPDVVGDGDLVVDGGRREATRDGVRLALTGREFDLLRHFLAHPGVAFTRDDLLQQVWGWTVGDHSTVTVHVRRLREKVEPDPALPRRLVTVWGVGYRWDAVTGQR
ncbi:response regulator transcription factor [Nocardioides sp. C4-1]|uniref:response regulator transcription factor n=1 Tax=Nocardioides sp. C4-1 TaxID=3151851 RepID=UPI0032649BC3